MTRAFTGDRVSKARKGIYDFHTRRLGIDRAFDSAAPLNNVSITVIGPILATFPFSPFPVSSLRFRALINKLLDCGLKRKTRQLLKKVADDRYVELAGLVQANK
ncbi:hypothetical protein PUN28_015582 [Cardiocondyla obscurior]|uniref:Uncharacterized protein n=1 Tax=Cardiocondyla obscurior TaxID=286306 RepID=A0AAW2ETV2_9HYME